MRFDDNLNLPDFLMPGQAPASQQGTKIKQEQPWPRRLFVWSLPALLLALAVWYAISPTDFLHFRNAKKQSRTAKTGRVALLPPPKDLPSLAQIKPTNTYNESKLLAQNGITATTVHTSESITEVAAKYENYFTQTGWRIVFRTNPSPTLQAIGAVKNGVYFSFVARQAVNTATGTIVELALMPEQQRMRDLRNPPKK